MQKTIKILALLFCAQLLLALGIGYSDRGIATQAEVAPLITVSREAIDRIRLEGVEGESVSLVKRDDGWRLPEVNDFPADTSRVDQLIERLIDLRTGTPVATSSGAKERFKVSDDSFERRITLAHGDESLARLYLGNSPGMHRIRARADGKDEIYSVKMAAYDVPVKVEDWEDKTLLSLPKSEIMAIEPNGLRIERVEPVAESNSKKEQGSATPAPAWKADGLEKGKRLQPEAVDKLARLLATLHFDRVLGQEANKDYGLEKPVLEVSLSRKGGDTRIYRLGKPDGQEEYTLKVSGRPEYFRLASYAARPLIEAAAPEQLVTTVAAHRDQAGETANTGHS
jgi:hypothetical protein